MIENDQYAFGLWNDLDKQLNESQKSAIKSAVKNSFQLIHGPPGIIKYKMFDCTVDPHCFTNECIQIIEDLASMH